MEQKPGHPVTATLIFLVFLGTAATWGTLPFVLSTRDWSTAGVFAITGVYVIAMIGLLSLYYRWVYGPFKNWD